MANVKISALQTATAATGSDVVPLVQGGVTKKLSMSALLSSPTLFGSGMSTFLATPSSATLGAIIGDKTGSGAAVFASSPALNSPTMTTPTLGVASATSINKLTITAPATSATLTIANGKTLTASNSLTLAGTDATTMTFPSTTATVARTDAGQNFSGTQTFAGPVVVGATSAPSTQRVQIVGDATAGAANVLLRRFSNDASGCNYVLSKSRGTSATATTIVQNGDSLGAITWQAADGATFTSCAQIVGFMDGVPAAGDLPTAINFATTPAGSAVASTRMTINNAGIVDVRNTVRAHSTTAIPAGGTTGAGFLLSSQNNFGVFFGSGAPTLSAVKGSLYLRSDGSGTNDRMYVNTDGGTTWTAVVTVA